MELFSPVENLSLLQVLLEMCCHKRMLIHQQDVDTAFLYVILEEEVYVSPPLGVCVGCD